MPYDSKVGSRLKIIGMIQSKKLLTYRTSQPTFSLPLRGPTTNPGVQCHIWSWVLELIELQLRPQTSHVALARAPPLEPTFFPASVWAPPRGISSYHRPLQPVCAFREHAEKRGKGRREERKRERGKEQWSWQVVRRGNEKRKKRRGEEEGRRWEEKRRWREEDTGVKWLTPEECAESAAVWL